MGEESGTAGKSTSTGNKSGDRIPAPGLVTGPEKSALGTGKSQRGAGPARSLLPLWQRLRNRSFTRRTAAPSKG
jgi:hypothetical protein